MKEIYKRALWLSISVIVSRILGLLFIFPFMRIIKEEGMKIYNYAYIPFLFFLDISSIGIIPTISKMTSSNSKEQARYIFIDLKKILIVVGIIFFIIFNIIIDKYIKIECGYYNNNATRLARILSISLLINPISQVYRGYLMGNLKVMYNAISNVLETFFRMTFMLLSAYIVINKLNLDYMVALYLAVSLNPICLLIGMIPLKIGVSKLKYNKEYIKYRLSFLYNTIRIGISTMFLTIIETIDSITYIKYTNDINKEAIFKAMSFESHRLIILPVIIIQSLGGVILPDLNKNKKKRYENVGEILNVSVVLLMVAFVFYRFFSKEIYNFFYKNEYYYILKYSSILIVIYGINKVLIGIYEGVFGKLLLPILSFIAYIFKYLFNVLFINEIGYKGMILSSNLSILIIIIGVIFLLYKKKYINIKKVLLLPLIFLILLIPVFIIKNINRGIITSGIVYLLIVIMGLLNIFNYKQNYLF